MYGSLVYVLHLIGGPNDGEISFAIRPYYRLTLSDGSVYNVKDENDYVEWVDDETRKITLYYVGRE